MVLYSFIRNDLIKDSGMFLALSNLSCAVTLLENNKERDICKHQVQMN